MTAPTRFLRWWFEDRRTGRITVAQFPNWPLWGIAVAWIVGGVATEGSPVADLAAAATIGLWLWWGTDELVRGVNPWRRLLGVAVIAWQAARLIS
jgi:hypothetical protein